MTTTTTTTTTATGAPMIALSDETDILTSLPLDDLVEILEQAHTHFDCMDDEEAEMIGITPERAESLAAKVSDLLTYLRKVESA